MTPSLFDPKKDPMVQIDEALDLLAAMIVSADDLGLCSQMDMLGQIISKLRDKIHVNHCLHEEEEAFDA